MNKFKDLFSASVAVTSLAGLSGQAIQAATVGDVIAQGLKTCRAIKLSQISKEDFAGGLKLQSLCGDGASGTKPELQFLGASFPCDKPDFFVSHSMHDSASAKWEALTAVAERFSEEYGREPNLWIDKYCVDQCNVSAQLQFIPVYVMCCDRVLVLSGPTYFKRLWCCFELFVYSMMYPRMQNILFWSLEGTSIESVKRTTDNFKMCEVNCFMESDKTAITAVICACIGGSEGFERSIRELGRHVYNRYMGLSDLTKAVEASV